MKRTLLPVALAVMATSAQAQLKSVWDYTQPSNGGHSMRVSVAPDGGVYSMAVDGDTENIRITKTDSNGICKWTKRVASTQPWNCHIAVDSMGNPYTSISLGGAMTSVSRLNPATGTVVWSEVFEANSGGGLAFDPQNNPVYAGKSNLRPYVVKFNPQGQVIFATSVDMAWHYTSSLAISENGRIFITTSNGKKENGAVILTPNGTIQVTRLWENFVIAYDIYEVAYEAMAAIDNNGNCYAVERSSSRTFLRIRPIEVNATPQPIEIQDPEQQPGRFHAEFDAKNRMILVNGSGDVYNTSIVSRWLEFQGATLKSGKMVKVMPDPSFRFTDINVAVDQFGQAYVAASLKLDGGWTGKNQVYALDIDSASPIWKTDFGPAHSLLYAPAVGVGRWGQVAASNQLGDQMTELIRGTRQYGLRNVTINGYGFTGGKTITGTVSMYGDYGDPRTIQMTSNSAYAKIAPQVTIPAGQLQAPISVELLPTTIRRAVRIEAKHGGITRNTVFYVEPPVVSALAIYPPSIRGGGTVNATARINGIAPFGGIEVALASDNSAAQMPMNVMIDRNATAKSFQFSTAPVSQSTIVKLTATTGTVTKTTFLTVNP